MAAAKKIYVANTSGAAEVKGEVLPFVKDVTRVAEGHGLLKAVPDYFTLADDAPHYGAGSASAKAETETR